VFEDPVRCGTQDDKSRVFDSTVRSSIDIITPRAAGLRNGGAMNRAATFRIKILAI
jgi:hypothetical protein